MQIFRAPSAELVTPDGWRDASTYVVAGPQSMGFAPNVVVSFTTGVMDPYLRRHVDIQLNEMRQKLPGFQLVARSEPFATPYGQAITVEYEWTSAEAGIPLHQYQLYMMAGQTLYTVTATGPALRWTDLRQSLLEIVHSFRPTAWPPQPPVNPAG